MMEQHKHSEAEARLHQIAYSGNPGEVADTLHDEAKGMLGTGYPREELREDLQRLALDLRRDGHEDLEDDILEVMDVLVGWCATSARI